MIKNKIMIRAIDLNISDIFRLDSTQSYKIEIMFKSK